MNALATLTRRLASRANGHFGSAAHWRVCFCLASALEISCSSVLGIEAGSESAESCNTNEQCAPGMRCYKQHCLSACGSSNDCNSSHRCENDVCVPTGDLCLPSDTRCNGHQPQVCQSDNSWANDGDECPLACNSGVCLIPNSCLSDPLCGQNPASCCANDVVPGTTFTLSYESSAFKTMSVERTVKPFLLDRFEVTVSRFYPFLRAYDEARQPLDDAGAQMDLPGSGWRHDWSDDLDGMFPSSATLEADIVACAAWPQVSDFDVPIRCVNWYVAFAFCIWDGGRLPTEAEWTYAAMEGDSHRVYPFSNPPEDTTLDQGHARYFDDDDMWSAPNKVGQLPLGVGAFGQYDLAGNVWEWIADSYREQLGTKDCGANLPGADTDTACSDADSTPNRVLKGGSFSLSSTYLANTARSADRPQGTDPSVGFRCARNWN
jgi:sulfatase modifying factor 1